MYKIAIVDDNKFDLFRMNNFVTENPEFDSTQMEISTYPSGVDFLEENKDNFGSENGEEEEYNSEEDNNNNNEEGEYEDNEEYGEGEEYNN